MTNVHVIAIRCGKDNQWYWTARARNGEIVADGAEGYGRLSDARRAALAVHPGVTIEVLPDPPDDPHEPYEDPATMGEGL